MTAGPVAIDYGAAPGLGRARHRSLALLHEAERRLAAIAPTHVETVAVGGSLGRLEVAPGSDFDCLMIALPRAPATGLRRDVEAIMEALAGLDLELPKADGIYRTPIGRDALLDTAALGSLGETPEVFGKRMQILLDARPVFGAKAFRALRAEVLRWYGTGFIEHDPGRSWTHLINDLVRYLHAYAAWQQYKLERTPRDSWELRHAKLRSSRVLTFAALLFLLGASNHRRDKVEWLLARLDAAPIERLAAVMRAHDPAAFVRVLRAYEHLHVQLANPATRKRLVAGGPDASTGPGRARSAAFTALEASADELADGLVGFLLARRGEWDRRFFARLIL